MLQASALFLGVFGLWLGLQQRFDAATIAGGALAALACVRMTARLPHLGRGTFTRMPQLAAVQVARLGSAFAEALTTIRAAIAADVKLTPALVRVRTRTDDALSTATLAAWIGAAPGAVVIATDSDGLLVHVNNESDERFANMRHWEEVLAPGLRGERSA
ncbi:MAG: Na+/H+ antiporter subunit E [Proteobacteria bacterium]|nr:Na+/H+ antiporter subunit E [Pseudomonadota bacterium]